MSDTQPKGATTDEKTAHWRGYTTEAYIGVDKWREPKWAERRFYRCGNCRTGTVVQTNYCASCGSKMIRESQRRKLG